MEIKKIEYAYFIVYENRFEEVQPEVVDISKSVEKKRVSIPKDAEGIYIKALGKGISPVREKVSIAGSISKTVKVEGSPFLDIEFEDRYVGSLSLVVREIGEIIIPSKIVKGSIRIDMGSKLVIAGDIKKTEIKLKRTSSLVFKRPVVDCIISGDLASLVIDVSGEEFYTYSSVWNIKTFKLEFRAKQPGEGARIYSSHFHLTASDAFLPYYLAFVDTKGDISFSLLSSVINKVKFFVGRGMSLSGSLQSPLVPVDIVQEDHMIIWKEVFPGELEFSSNVFTDEFLYKGLTYMALVKDFSSNYGVMLDMLGFYGLEARTYIPLDIQTVRNVFARIEALDIFPEEEMPIGNYMDKNTQVGMSFSAISYPLPFSFANSVLDPDDYIIIKVFDKSKMYKLVLSRERFLTLMKGWNNILKEV